MWLLKQKKTEYPKNAHEEHLERLREYFGPHTPEEELLNPAKTADGHCLEEFVVCFECKQLVLKSRAKGVEHRYPKTRYFGGRWHSQTVGIPDHIEYYCPAHAPAWDVIHYPNESECSYATCTYYRRVAAVPERLEEIVEPPKRKTRKSKAPKGGKPIGRR